MAGRFRNFGLAGAFLLAVALIAVAFQSALWGAISAALLAVAGVVVLRGNRWRTGSLLVAALALSLALLDVFAGLLTPGAVDAGLVKKTVPRHWPPPDPVLGFRPLPNTEVRATATFNDQIIYDQTYHFDAAAARVTPPGPPGADTYLFMGDSFVFGQGLADDQTLAAQFVRERERSVNGINLGVPGYGPNHLVRAFEAGLLDHYAGKNVKAVVTWIIPAHLARVTGEGSWLGSSPRYVLDDGALRFTGTFTEHRLRDPLAGLRYLLGEQFAFIDAIGRNRRQDEQVALFLALMARLQELAREKLGARLVVVYSWPDETSQRGYGGTTLGRAMLVSTLAKVRDLGPVMVSVDTLTNGIPASRLLIPHDGHPSAYTNELMARQLKRQLDGL